MNDNRTTELKTLSKLKTAGRLHYWRGTIEIPETELHAICDEIQAEYDNAVHALNKAAGNWAKADAELRAEFDGIPMTEENMTAHGLVRERTCRIVKEKRTLRSMLHGECEVVDEKCSECGGYMDVGFGVIRNFCPNCGARVVD